jgi:hypothetical protein
MPIDFPMFFEMTVNEDADDEDRDDVEAIAKDSRDLVSILFSIMNCLFLDEFMFIVVLRSWRRDIDSLFIIDDRRCSWMRFK